jgi:hypothetical protein
VLEAFISTILEEVLHAAFAGVTELAGSRKARILKILALVALCSAFSGFILWATVAEGLFVPGTFLGGVAGVVFFFVFGAWTHVVNVCAEKAERATDGKAVVESAFQTRQAVKCDDGSC